MFVLCSGVLLVRVTPGRLDRGQLGVESKLTITSVCVSVCVVLDSSWQMSSLGFLRAVRINTAVDKKSPYPVCDRHFH